MRNIKGSITKDKPYRSTSLLEAVSDLFDEERAPSGLPKGIEEVERVTVEAVRIKFGDEVNQELLSRIAEEEGFSIQKGGFALRVIKKGAMIARVGSRSDFGEHFDLYVYIFPPETEKISVYRKILAEREGILDPYTGKINLEELCDFNLKAIRLVSRYIREKYG